MFRWSNFSIKNQLKAHGYYKQVVDHVCSLIVEQLKKKKKELVPCDTPWSVWTHHDAVVNKTQAMVKLEVMKRQKIPGRKRIQGQSVLLKPRMEFVLSSVGGRTMKQKPGIDDVLMSKTVSLKQVKNPDERVRPGKRGRHRS